MNAGILTVDDLHFELRRSPQRRSVQITVDRGGELLLAAPDECSFDMLEAFVREKRFWIYTKLVEKEALWAPPSKKQYVSGEGFPYLGRSYRLLLVDEQEAPLKLIGGRFQMRRTLAGEGPQLMVRWYREHAAKWLAKRVDRLKGRIEVEPSGLKVQDLGYRWGSCGRGGKLYFHWRSILLPAQIAEYIVAHELVHLHEAHHTPEFWRRLERAMPDYAVRKRWLMEHGREVEGIEFGRSELDP